MSHRRAVVLMVGVTLLWSIAGVVTRQLDSARGFETTFWRSLFNALALTLMLGWLRGPAALWRTLRGGGRALWISGACWCVMFTAFMLALSLTSVANVLVTMALAPLFTALGARFALGHRLAPRTWVAIVIAGGGIGWMYGAQLGAGDARQLLGTAVALGVPIAAAVYYDDMYVHREFQDETAQIVPNMKLWHTNEYEHNGLRADGEKILGRLIAMVRGEV